jgi:hypothetical protein
VIVPVPFTAGYVGRAGNSTGSLATAWVASDNLGGAPPVWILGSKIGTVTNTVPLSFTNMPLHHVGAPNFGAPAIPGIAIVQSGGSTQVSESGGTDSYTIALTVAPAGPVTVQITAGPQVQLSTNGGSSFATSIVLSLNNTIVRTITLRALEDNVVDAATHFSPITQVVTATGDATRYPLSTPIPDVRVSVLENDSLLLSEVKVNPPGTDAPNEYVEIRGPGALLTNVYLLAIDGAWTGRGQSRRQLVRANAWRRRAVVRRRTRSPLHDSARNGSLHPPQFASLNGAIENESISILLRAAAAELMKAKTWTPATTGCWKVSPGSATILTRSPGLMAGATTFSTAAWT